jgi:hypothetical protein
LKASEYDGKRVMYVDHFRLTHDGVIVGSSDDGKQLLVRSLNPKAPAGQWHFSITPELFPALEVPSKKTETP